MGWDIIIFNILLLISVSFSTSLYCIVFHFLEQVRVYLPSNGWLLMILAY